ncbi:hypothetical protein TraAM80_08882 [Trypanosoma rangeli]|uniref:Uncharacterized protein n=1 Tax=Trypanosoma rangeli TaxID=5698 RepID=A0A422MYF7_TRYRA|nr:uncharacterized protein TraAM80_08882 [Trypanosoma rangeli]RNE98258.1 hypothetical protein TraAM80_08882 [Trypanosoma rangeli]|eukprot:RNE98258.1 hypothetical protein TraAM80_08882 [Trypanosoma rangeli]
MAGGGGDGGARTNGLAVAQGLPGDRGKGAPCVVRTCARPASGAPKLCWGFPRTGGFFSTPLAAAWRGGRLKVMEVKKKKKKKSACSDGALLVGFLAGRAPATPNGPRGGRKTVGIAPHPTPPPADGMARGVSARRGRAGQVFIRLQPSSGPAQTPQIANPIGMEPAPLQRLPRYCFVFTKSAEMPGVVAAGVPSSALGGWGRLGGFSFPSGEARTCICLFFFLRKKAILLGPVSCRSSKRSPGGASNRHHQDLKLGFFSIKRLYS